MKHILLIIGLCALGATVMPARGQTRIMLNGGSIVLSNGAHLVIENPNSDAITVNQGGIVCPTGNEKVNWLMGNTTGTYKIPFVEAGKSIPLSFTKSAGTGPGYFSLSTYATPTWQNSLYMPVGMLNLNNGIEDNSKFVLNRFWEISALNYSIKPQLGNLIFSYLDPEHQAPGNTITEANLKAQRWNDIDQTWDDYRPSGNVNTNDNIVRIPQVLSANLYSYWVLVDAQSPLPVELVYFQAAAAESHTALSWETASETDCDYFAIERSADGIQFSEILQVKGAGTTTNRTAYKARDLKPLSGTSYYRLRQADFNGEVSYSAVRSVYFGTTNEQPSLAVFPNPTQQHFSISLSNVQTEQRVQIAVTDLQGRLIFTEQLQVNQTNFQHTPAKMPTLPAGTYLLSATTETGVMVQRLVIR